MNVDISIVNFILTMLSGLDHLKIMRISSKYVYTKTNMELEHSNVEDLMFKLLSSLKFLLYVLCLKLQCEYFE